MVIRMLLFLFILALPCSVFAEGKWTHYGTEGISEEILDITVDKHNVKWFGTNAGVVRFDGKLWKTYTVADGLVNPIVFAVAVD